MTPWQQYQGEVIAGRYPLHELLHSDEQSAIFRTEAGEDRKRAVLHLLHVDADHLQQYESRWESLARTTNPHLLRVYDSGHASEDDDSLVYLVSEEPDDVLASVLAERPMSEEETREVVEAVSDALATLHTHGLVHGNLSPGSVFAVGNSIRLSGDGVPLAEDASAADDMWDLGLLIIACLNQRVPDRALLPHVVGKMRQPFRQIVERTIDSDPQKRWTAHRVRSLLAGNTPVELPETPPSSIRMPSVNNTVKYAAGTAAAVLLAFVGISWMRSPETTPARQVAAVPDVKPSPVAAPPVQQAAPAPKRAVAAARPEGVRSRVTTPVATPVPGGHLVVVATYNRLEDAQKRARAISARWSRFPATVYAPHQPNPPYLVTIGTNLSKEAAHRLQQRARSAGLPRDTYVTK